MLTLSETHSRVTWLSFIVHESLLQLPITPVHDPSNRVTKTIGEGHPREAKTTKPERHANATKAETRGECR